MRFSLRLRLRLAASLISGLLGVSAIVLLAILLATHSSSGGAAPPPASLTARATAANLLSSLLSSPATSTPIAGERQAFIWPADGYVLQGMTPTHPTGIDIAAPLDSEIRAARDGTVFFVGGDPCCSYGKHIVIGHDGGWSTVYGHLDKFLVKVGDQVKQGQVIGLAGATGHATGPHLHFELRSNGRPVNPLDYLFPARYLAVGNSAPRSDRAPNPTATDTPRTGFDASEATVLGIGWMVQNQEAAYTIDASTCYAIKHGANWLVTCRGTLAGCTGTGPCSRYLSACVLDQPRLIARFC